MRTGWKRIDFWQVADHRFYTSFPNIEYTRAHFKIIYLNFGLNCFNYKFYPIFVYSLFNMFGFPEVKHKTFKNNFLKTVVFQVIFEPNKEIISKKDLISELFEESFPRFHLNTTEGINLSFNKDFKDPILTPLAKENFIEMKSLDGQKIISINATSISVTYGGKIYKDFSRLITDLGRFKDFFSICNIKKVNRVSIRKINNIEFKADAGNPSEFLEYVISPELLSNQSYFPSSEYIKKNIKNIQYSINDIFLNLIYGLNIPPKNIEEIGQIILDIDLMKNREIDINAIFEEAKGLNSEIFNIFNWAISDNTIELLDK